MTHRPFRTSFLGILLAAILAAVPVAAAPGDQGRVARPARGETARPTARPITVAADGTMTVTGASIPLKSVLSEITVRMRIPIILAEGLQAAQTSIVLQRVPLEEGLKRLLAGYDTFYRFSAAEEGSAGSIKGIWIFPRGEGKELEPVPPSMWASTKDFEQQLGDADAEVRTGAYEALIERQGERALPTVLRGLVDEDEGVRLATFSAALDSGVEIPSIDLHSVVLNDRSQTMRLLALQAVEGRPDAHDIARTVQDDLDQVVRNQARLMLGLSMPDTRQQPNTGQQAP